MRTKDFTMREVRRDECKNFLKGLESPSGIQRQFGTWGLKQNVKLLLMYNFRRSLVENLGFFNENG